MNFLNFLLLLSASLFLPVTGCEDSSSVQAAANLPEVALYDQAVPENDPVDDDWFSDTAMIGHSLMRGMEGYSGLDTPDYYTLSGSSVSQLLSSSEVELPGGGQGKLSTALGEQSYERVYLFMGVNEICGDLSTLKADYQQLLDLVRETSPEASIYVLAVTPVTRNKAAGGTFTLERISAYNEMLLDLCGEQECWYVDTYECFAGEDGYLPSGASSDGIHLKKEQYPVLRDYLKSHTVD